MPGMPDRIELTKDQLTGIIAQGPSDMQDIRNQVREAELTSDGVVVNSFYELEPRYAEEYRKVKGNKAWCIGPLSLCNSETPDKAERGNKASIDENKCLKWLDSREPLSVVYACFGSLCRLVPSQLVEIGLGLEASNHPFIWVIREDKKSSELERWLLEEGFEERTKDRGLLIRGWAPQLLILAHPAIGGFLTHCGWNSTLEGVCAGVPMVTWPMFEDQFTNEKVIVQISGTGVRVGVDVPCRFGDEEKVGVYVKWEEVEKAIGRLMDGGEEGEGRRKRARELGEIAKKAIEEGGSSHSNMTHLIQFIMQRFIENPHTEGKGLE